MDEEGIKRVCKLCVGMLLLISIFQVLPGEISHVGVAKADSNWTQNQEQEFLSGSLDNSAIKGSGPLAQIELDLNMSGKWEKMSPLDQPDGRRGHVTSSIYGTDKVLLFGGYNGGYYDDTWVYDLSDDQWTNMGVASDHPSARHSFAMAFISETYKIILFGGTSLSGLDNETWMYDLTNNTWLRLKPLNSPSAREYHELEPVYNDDKVVLFGGFDGTDYLDDTWVYDLSDNEWVKMIPTEKPSPRKGHEMATIYGSDEMVFFGGNESGLFTVDDTWTYDVGSDEWIEKNPTGDKPLPRRGHGMGCVYDTDFVLLFGPDDQTWIYDLSDNSWTQKTPTIQPSPRYITHGMAPIFNDDKVVMFGGGFDNNGTIIDLNDTWVFDLASYEEEGTFLSSPYNIGDGAKYKTLSWIADTVSGTNVKFQLRSAETESALTLETPVGPFGNPLTYYTISLGQDIWEGHDYDPWIQYKIYLSGTSEVTPKVHEVNINYNYEPKIPPISGPQNDAWVNENIPMFSWTFSDLDGIQGGFQILIDDDENFLSIDYDSGMQSSRNEIWQFPEGTVYSEIPDGNWFWKVRTQDNDGDWGPYSPASNFQIDSHGPTSSITTPVNSGFYSSLSVVSGETSDNGGSGIESIEITLKRVHDGLYWTDAQWEAGESWLLASGTLNWEYNVESVIWENGNQYEVSVRATDLASNMEIASQKNLFSIDSHAPSATINPQLDMVYLEDLDTITGTAQDSNGAGVDFIKIMIIRNLDENQWDGTSWKEGSYWLFATGSDTWSFDSRNVDLIIDTYYTVRAYATDKVGNIGTYNEVTFMTDKSSPASLSITINNGDSYTKDSDVILYLYAADSGSGLDKMGFSSDGTHWSAWEDYKVTKPYSLSSGDGQKTIYFRVKDKAGNQANGIFATITLDTTEPIFDSDEDGIQDYQDAFPEDPAASIDTDSDGYPDLWNTGKSQGHSTTGLTLDEYPSNPSLHAKEISQPKEKKYDTYWFLIVPLIAVILLVVFVMLMWRNKKKISKIVLFYRRYF
jgi:hypothetical protein